MAAGLDAVVRSEALEAACRRYRVRALDIFGSAATGHGFNAESSDVDLIVAFEPLTPAAYADAYFGLRAALEDLLGRPVDLLTETALENPYLRRRVAAERRPLFRGEP